MKVLVTNYTFNAAAKTITFNDYSAISLESVLLITNVTDGIVIYNFADATKGGTAATNVLTLEYDTTAMSDTDDIQIYYDDPAAGILANYKTVTGTAGSLNADCITSTNVGNYKWVALQITGTFTATVTFQWSNDNTNWQSLVLSRADQTGTVQATSSSTNVWWTGPVPGLYFRVRATSYTSGTVEANALFTSMPTMMPAIGIAGVVPGVTATSLGKAEDAAHTSGDTGVMLLAVRNDTRGTLAGTNGDYAPPQLNASGDIRSELSSIAGTAASVNNGTADAGTQRVTIASDSTGQVALAAGTNGIGKLTANDGVDIGDVTVNNGSGAAAVNIQDGGNSITVDGTVTASNTAGNVAHDAADSGNPVKQGNKATTSLSGVTLVANNDRTDAYAGVDGVPIVRPHCNLEDIVSGNASNTDGTSTQVIATSGAGVKTYITSVTITNTSASNIYVELKDGTTAKWTFPVPANGGVTHTFAVPLPGTANTAWNFDPSAAATTVYCSAVGFKSKV